MLNDPSQTLTPCLLVYPDVIRQNLKEAIRIAGGASRLRPHVKTHKTAEIVRMELEAGISKHKCATLSEATMLADSGADDVLVAYPQVGPNIAKLAEIVARFPACRFSVAVDDAQNAKQLDQFFESRGRRLDVFIDLDTGMHRTGIAPGESAVGLFEQIRQSASLQFAGLHIYDGQNHQSSLSERTQAVRELMQPVVELLTKIACPGEADVKLVCGGTPTFPVFSQWEPPPNTSIELSPGTCVLNDFNYNNDYRDMQSFGFGALLLTRIISKPGANLLTVDLGYKAVSADPPADRRCHFLDLPAAKLVQHSEEHLVVQTPDASRFHIGDVLYAVPAHICPTVALHSHLHVVEGGDETQCWAVAARDRLR